MKLYTSLTDWWPLLSAPEEYEEEAGVYTRYLLEAGGAPARTLVEFGSGGGNNASFMKRHFEMTLVEPSAGMRAMSAALNPECEHVQGDMRSARLGREFDRVFIHDAICYMTSIEDLRKAAQTAFEHCRAGGAALLCPDYVRETFAPDTECGGHDGVGRSLRYLAWSWDPDPADSTYLVDYAYLLREGENIRVEHDRHLEGLFAAAEWMQVLTETGFEVRAMPYRHSDVERELDTFLCLKPG